MAAVVSEQWGEILPVGNLWFPTAKQMKCAGMNNRGCTHTHADSGQRVNPQASEGRPVSAAPASSAGEEYYPLLAAEIRWAALLSPPFGAAVCSSARYRVTSTSIRDKTPRGGTQDEIQCGTERREKSGTPLQRHLCRCSHLSLILLPQYLPVRHAVCLLDCSSLLLSEKVRIIKDKCPHFPPVPHSILPL